LSDAIPKGPVLLIDLNQVNKNILHADFKFVVQTLVQLRAELDEVPCIGKFGPMA
jgi:hypothetical protein